MNLLTETEIAAVQAVLVEELGVRPEKLTPEARLDADLGADSLTKVEIVMALEDRLAVTLSDELTEKVESVEDVYDAVAFSLGGREPRD